MTPVWKLLRRCLRATGAEYVAARDQLADAWDPPAGAPARPRSWQVAALARIVALQRTDPAGAARFAALARGERALLGPVEHVTGRHPARARAAAMEATLPALTPTLLELLWKSDEAALDPQMADALYLTARAAADPLVDPVLRAVALGVVARSEGERRRATVALFRRDPAAAPLRTLALDARAPESVRRTAVLCLAEAGDRSATPVVVRTAATRRNPEGLRLQALHALEALGDVRSLRVVERIWAASPPGDIKSAAASVVEQLRRREPG